VHGDAQENTGLTLRGMLEEAHEVETSLRESLVRLPAPLPVCTYLYSSPHKGTRVVQASSEDDRGLLELRLAKARAELQVLQLHSRLEHCRAPVRYGTSIRVRLGLRAFLSAITVTVSSDQVKDAKLHSSTEQIEVNCCGRLSVLVR
jgi:hypothetical protein